jgi:prepilin-type N-terminal cleavage/methylation domain-containing protein
MSINSVRGFTLIELLVVITIIGMLASITMVQFQDGQKLARDAKRKQDLHYIAVGMEIYRQIKGTYVINPSGSGSCSCGWFNYEGGSYTRSIARAMKEEGLVDKIIVDPTKGLTSTPATGYTYMKYQCGSGFFVYAKLEKPSAADSATCNANSCCDGLRTSYGMNYAVGHR